MCVVAGAASEREVVTTMATTLNAWRPSALPAACPSIGTTRLGMPGEGVEVVLSPAPVHLPAHPVVATSVTTPPAYVATGRTPALKINNYIGTPAAVPAMGLAVVGATVSSLIVMATGEFRNQQRGADKVKGSDARGIPPRGRRQV
jgi:hypothetical protein